MSGCHGFILGKWNFGKFLHFFIKSTCFWALIGGFTDNQAWQIQYNNEKDMFSDKLSEIEKILRYQTFLKWTGSPCSKFLLILEKMMPWKWDKRPDITHNAPLQSYQTKWNTVHFEQYYSDKIIFENKNILRYQTFLNWIRSYNSHCLKITKYRPCSRISAIFEMYIIWRWPLGHNFILFSWFFISYLCTSDVPLSMRYSTIIIYLIYTALDTT